jgi:hypothetical protein
MFLIRAAFWLTIVVLLLPADPPSSEATNQVDAFQAIGAARDTVADVSSFCDRNPETCVTGNAVFDLLARKVRFGVRKVTEYFESSGESQKAAPAQDGTLTDEDAVSPWHPPKRPRAT